MDLTKTCVMVDTETLSTLPNAVCLSIGAVKFNQDGIMDRFMINIDPTESKKLGHHISQDTLDWWKKQKPDVLKQSLQSAVLPLEAITKFTDWYGTKSLQTFSKGSYFDFPIIEEYYRTVGMSPPWKYWDVKCYRTIMDMVRDIEPDKIDGDLHNALVDSEYQANHLIKIWRELNG
jgi:exodeoxyribonuclease VIII